MAEVFRFGPVELRPAQRQALVDGEPVALGTRAFDVLMALASRAGEVVTKDALLNEVWKGRVVEENNLDVQVSALRKAIGKGAIATLPGRGYVFTLTRTEPPSPAPATASKMSLVGRRAEIKQLRELLKATPLVTLTGPGGIGKTRLAQAALATLAPDYPDGAHFIPLASLSDPQQVPVAIATALGSERGQLTSLLRGKRVLVVLDNLEQLLPQVAAVVAELMSITGLTVVATSRERLDLSMEQEFPVPLLATADAIDLFVLRARRLDPAFEPDAHVAGIVQRLQGLALAIELAAAKTRVLTTEQILARLQTCLDLLTDGPRDAPERQRTLHATIDWSYALLSPQEREGFGRCGVFRGGFGLEAAAAVAGVDLPTLTSLVDKSLLGRGNDGRFLMLDSIRAYALERLAQQPEHAEVERLHAEHMLGLMDRAQVDLARWQQTVSLAYGDFLQALRWMRDAGHPGFVPLTVGLSKYWGRYDRYDEGRQWMLDALERCGGGSRERAVLLADLAQFDFRQGKNPSAKGWLAQAVEAAQALGDKRQLAWVSALQGSISAQSGDLVAGRLGYERCLGISEEIGDHARESITWGDLGLIALSGNNPAHGQYCFEQQLTLARRHGLARCEMFAHLHFALLHALVGDGASAEPRAILALGIAKEQGRMNELPMAENLIVLAAAYALLGVLERAAVLLASARAYVDSVGAELDPLANLLCDRVIAACSQSPDVDLIEAARFRGALLTLKEAVLFALDGA